MGIKIDLAYIMQLIYFIAIASSIYMCLKQHIINKINRCKICNCNVCTKINLDFSKCFTVDKFNTYEKIDVWRYCTLY